MNATTTQELFDARELPCEIKRPALISRCVNLPAGTSFTFVNGHEPVPLRRYMEQRFPGCFRWDLLEPLADGSVCVRVTKLAEPPGGFPEDTGHFHCH